MEFEEFQSLSEIASISKKIVEAFGGEVHLTRNDYDVAQSSNSNLIAIDLEHFDQSFRQLPISDVLASKLCTIFRQKIKELQMLHMSDIVQIRNALRKSGKPDRIFNKYIEIIHKRFKKSSEDIHDAIVKSIKVKIEHFHRDAATTDMESGSESDTVHKGHSSYAVAILEKVFSKQTNISRPEKYQLAIATNLKPKQVTIWFQNRRNRNRQVVNKEPKAEVSTPKGKKRKYDGMDEEPRTPTQRRRLSQNDLMSSSASTVFTYGTPLSISSSADASVTSNDSELFEQQQADASIESIDSDFFDKQQSSGLRCISGSSMTTSYDDGSCVFEGSTFGNTSFDDHLQKLASSDDSKYNKESDMIFNKDGQVMLDMEDLEINLSTFGAEFSQMRFPAIDFTLTTPSAYETAPRNATQFQLSSEGMSEEEILMQCAKQMVEKDFSAQGELQRIQKEDHWQTGTLDKIFFGNDITNTISSNAGEMSLSEICSSQGSSQNGASSSQASTPKSVFDFSLEGLGLDEILKHNKESIEEAESPMNTFTPMSQVTFNFPTPKMLCTPFSPTKASST